MVENSVTYCEDAACVGAEPEAGYCETAPKPGMAKCFCC